MTNKNLTDERITELYGKLFDELEVHQRATGEEGYFAVQCEEVMSALKELQEYRKAGTPELKMADLINKFYERYPLETFKSDSERAEALGYFMAGAEIQCFGEFVKYEDLCSDE